MALLHGFLWDLPVQLVGELESQSKVLSVSIPMFVQLAEALLARPRLQELGCSTWMGLN